MVVDVQVKERELKEIATELLGEQTQAVRSSFGHSLSRMNALWQLVLVVADGIAINLSFLLAFLIRTGGNIPPASMAPYRENFVFLTSTYLLLMALTRVFKKRFASLWELFTRVFFGLFLGSLFSISLVYVFRIRWSRFPSSVFLISAFLSLILVFAVNAMVLALTRRIKRRVVVIGHEEPADLVNDSRHNEKIHINRIEDLVKHRDIDEVIIGDRAVMQKNFTLLIWLLERLKTKVFFAPSLYADLLSVSLEMNGNAAFLSTFIGKKAEIEEFLIRALDVIVSVVALLFLAPVFLLICVVIRITSHGPALYSQVRAGKDGKLFRLFKFRSMVANAEELSGFQPATENDPRVTSFGRIIRRTRLDETPQFWNVLKGEMSLVGPRPENTYRVENHKALRGLRLAVKPGLTGLAQIRSLYDLNPRHKIKYDYLYIQRRSLLLNIFILLRTIPVVFGKKGW